MEAKFFPFFLPSLGIFGILLFLMSFDSILLTFTSVRLKLDWVLAINEFEDSDLDYLLWIGESEGVFLEFKFFLLFWLKFLKYFCGLFLERLDLQVYGTRFPKSMFYWENLVS